MPRPFKELSIRQIEALLDAYDFNRPISSVHIHHTWRPNHRQDRGQESVESIYRYHTNEKGWSDIGQHLTIDSKGRIWSGRSWSRNPASARRHNQGAFAIEMIGNFDAEKDSFEGPQKAATESVTARILDRFSLGLPDIRFHREFSEKSCPGSSISQFAFRNSVGNLLGVSQPVVLWDSLSPREKIEVEALKRIFQLDEGLPDDPVDAEPDHSGPDQSLFFESGDFNKKGDFKHQPENDDPVTLHAIDSELEVEDRNYEKIATTPYSDIKNHSFIELDTEPTELELAYDRSLDNINEITFSSMDCSSGSVQWPDLDSESTEYAHLTEIETESEFEITPEDIENLVKANRFQPTGYQNTIVLGIRGSRLETGYEAENQEVISLIDVRPNHVDFRCTLGFYFGDARNLTLFSGSTVPATFYVQDYYNLLNNRPHKEALKCNLMPTGCYVSRVDKHSKLFPAVRTSEPTDPTRDGAATVLRTTDDLSYSIKDLWDSGMIYDNIHCSYILHCLPKYGARFSSAGCSTVRGRKDPTDQWAKFQAVLNTLGRGKRTDYLLLTGREYAIAAKLRKIGVANDPGIIKKELARLRVGSTGEEVSRLQRELDIKEINYFDWVTKKRLTEFQRENGLRADGIFTPALDELLRWGVFD